MKVSILLKTFACAALLGLAACHNLKPLQAEVADLKSQVAKLQSDMQSSRQSSDQASAAAQAASQAASGAQSIANQALSAAQAGQACCDATNEKIDRMFKRQLEK